MVSFLCFANLLHLYFQMQLCTSIGSTCACEKKTFVSSFSIFLLLVTSFLFWIPSTLFVLLLRLFDFCAIFCSVSFNIMEIRSRTKPNTKIQFHTIFCTECQHSDQNAANHYKIELKDAVKYYIWTQSLILADTFKYNWGFL